MDDLTPRNPEAKPFAHHLRQWERRAVQFAARKLQRQKLGARLILLARTLREPLVNQSVRPVLLRTLRKAVLALAGFTKACCCGPIGLHRARQAVKNVRYMAEALKPALTLSSAAWIERLRRRQRLMGGIHDLDLLAKRLAQYVAKRRSACRALHPLQTSLIRRRQQLVRRYRAQRFPSPAMTLWFRHGRISPPP